MMSINVLYHIDLNVLRINFWNQPLCTMGGRSTAFFKFEFLPTSLTPLLSIYTQTLDKSINQIMKKKVHANQVIDPTAMSNNRHKNQSSIIPYQNIISLSVNYDSEKT